MDQTRNNQINPEIFYQSLKENQKNKYDMNQDFGRLEIENNKKNLNIKTSSHYTNDYKEIINENPNPYLYINENEKPNNSPITSRLNPTEANLNSEKGKENDDWIKTINKRLLDFGFFEIRYTKRNNLNPDSRIIIDNSSLASVLSTLLNEIEKQRLNSYRKMENNNILEIDKEKESEIINLKLTLEAQNKDIIIMQDLLNRAEVHIHSLVTREQTILSLSNKLKLAQDMLKEKDGIIEYLKRKEKENSLFRTIQGNSYENRSKE